MLTRRCAGCRWRVHYGAAQRQHAHTARQSYQADLTTLTCKAAYPSLGMQAHTIATQTQDFNAFHSSILAAQGLHCHANHGS